jgi:hypothetical protein
MRFLRFLRTVFSHLIPAETCSDGNLIVVPCTWTGHMKGTGLHVRLPPQSGHIRQAYDACDDQRGPPITEGSPDEFFSRVATAAELQRHICSSRT